MPSPAPSPRAATSEDLHALVEIERLCFEPPWSSKALVGIVQRRDAWIAEAPRAVVGEALFQTVLDETELLRLAVRPRWRRSGIGHCLLVHALQELYQRGIARCHLEVRADNRAALALYAAAGFRSIGIRPRYYADGTDAVLMCHRLQPA